MTINELENAEWRRESIRVNRRRLWMGMAAIALSLGSVSVTAWMHFAVIPAHRQVIAGQQQLISALRARDAQQDDTIGRMADWITDCSRQLGEQR